SGPRPKIEDTEEATTDSDTPSWMRLVRGDENQDQEMSEGDGSSYQDGESSQGSDPESNQDQETGENGEIQEPNAEEGNQGE
ncbi:MAG: hypothetical protein AAB214_19060, partial [Fibrobacterota bacterium]